MEIDRKANHLSIAIFLSILSFSLLAAIYESQNESSRHGLKIDHKYLDKNSSGIILDFDHEQGQKISNDLVLKINNGQGKTYFQNISQISNSSIGHKISLNHQEIKNVFIQSQSSIKIKKNGRVLLSIQQLPFLFIIVTKFFSYFFSCCRNIIIIATITGTFDLWMPLLLFVESFICLGFWTHDPHLFTQIYSRIFNSNLDIFNLIRFSISSQIQLSQNPYLANYGFTNRFAINCAGELSMLLVVLIGIFVLKLLTLFVKSQRLRSIGPKIRPIFNGYMFWLTPRILSVAGLSLRLIQTNVTVIQIINLALAALSIILIIVFFIMMIIQIRKINTKLQYLEESKNQIGLVTRIDYLKDFQFDCLEYSMLYYPVMNLLRVIFSHLCIGFAPDFHYVQFGGVIFGQVFYMMIQISCSGYKLTRDKIIYPIIDFVYGTFLLSLIGIGLIYGVGHLQLTMNLEKFAFSAIIFIVFILILQTLLDIALHIRNMRQNDSEQFQNPKKLKSNQAKSQYEQKDKRIEKYESEDVHTNEQQQKRQKTKHKEASGKKVKKVKNGKLI